MDNLDDNSVVEATQVKVKEDETFSRAPFIFLVSCFVIFAEGPFSQLLPELGLNPELHAVGKLLIGTMKGIALALLILSTVMCVHAVRISIGSYLAVGATVVTVMVGGALAVSLIATPAWAILALAGFVFVIVPVSASIFWKLSQSLLRARGLE